MRTAVEWYNQQIVDRQNGNGDSRSRDEIFNQAKEMEKEQIIDARVNAPLLNTESKYDYVIEAEQYYNQTFKQQEQ
jgi:hypothetical protein